MQEQRTEADAAEECDVVVIGGGPAGSTTATLLAQRGHHVVLLEKNSHPRFHIGESLLPANLPLFEKLGVAREIEAIGIDKWGAKFFSPWHDHTVQFEFGGAMDPTMPKAYEVRRSEFDEILFRNAGRSGARTHENCRVRDFELGDARTPAWVRATTADGGLREWRPKFVVDASGRDTLVANRLKIKRRNPDHNSSAMFGHFRGARRDPGRNEGNILIAWFEHGWFWFIPLKDGVTSVGAVVWPYYMKSRAKPLREFYLDTVAMCPELADRLSKAELVAGPEATGNYSYRCTSCQGENYVMVGDAFTFIDPVFSSGVMIAMTSGFAAADVVHARLADRAAEAKARKRLDYVMRVGPKQFSWFIYRVTNPNLRDLFMSPSDKFEMKKALLSILAGDVFRDTPIRRGLLGFRFVYYVYSLLHPRRSLREWRRRAFNIRDDSEMRAAATPR
ncbi:MAG TPA: NAD(P)/FAD-dependent oxidoreductase [Usitatibacter sp.]|nr:NAD(P)/FAD-dependent oxidoreductase [Usitatibacter sp.]